MTRKDIISTLTDKGKTKAVEFIEKHSVENSRSIHIGDANDKAYDSGLAHFLLAYCQWENTKYGFRAFFNNKH